MVSVQPAGGKVHLIGIGGIGMSAVALMLKSRGFNVQGSDDGVVGNGNIDRLVSLGISVFDFHAPEHVGGDVRTVIRSSAIPENNVELVAARQRGLPVWTRAQFLAELMRGKRCITVAGTNGKTTVTSLIGYVLDVAGFDPTIVSGGVMCAYGSNVRSGESEWMVVESDESDGSFVDFPVEIGVLTNVEPEHLEHYGGSFERQKEAFEQFVARASSRVIICRDCPTSRHLASRVPHALHYGLSSACDVYAEGVHLDDKGRFQAFDVVADTERFPVRLPLFGLHNVQNALAAVAVSQQVGVLDTAVVQSALAAFPGVERRFTPVGLWNGVSIFDDYGHHPTSIDLVLKGARNLTSGRVVAVFQPHRFTRFRDLYRKFLGCFSCADSVIVVDVYAAGEEFIRGLSVSQFCADLPRKAVYAGRLDCVAPILRGQVGPGDVVVFFGASHVMSCYARQMSSLLARLPC